MPKTKMNIKRRLQAVNKYLIRGDQMRIAARTGLHPIYVNQCFRGIRQNYNVLSEGARIAHENRELGLVKRIVISEK